MKLNKKEFSRFKELEAKINTKKATKEEMAEFTELKKLKDDKHKPSKIGFVPGNDFAWWNKIPELLKDSANFKSNYIAGRVIDSAHFPFVVPGAIVIYLATCYNAGSEPTDPINVWARNLYLKMFQKYRPASGYSASDLGITILAGLEAVKLIAKYERIYGIINRYSVLNVNMPFTEANALGLSVAQVTYLQGHMSDFRYDLNYLIKKAQRLCIPKDISFIADAISLFGYEYIDHSNPRGQIIIFDSQNYGVYSDTALSTGGSIQFDSLGAQLFDFTADNMCKALDTVLNALLGSDSVQRIYADLVVWFGAEAMLEFLPMPEEYVIAPVESKSILHKMHNMEAAPCAFSGGGTIVNRLLTSWAKSTLSTVDQGVVLNGLYHVYQVNDAIVTTGVVKDSNSGTVTTRSVNGIAGSILDGTTSVYGMLDAHLIDGYDVDVTPEFIVEGSLFKYVSEPTSASDDKAQIITSNVNWLVWGWRQYTPGGYVQSAVQNNWYTNNNYAMNAAAALALIDWAPLCYYITNTGLTNVVNNIYGDLDVIVPVSVVELTRVQQTCFMSGLATDVPVKV